MWNKRRVLYIEYPEGGSPLTKQLLFVGTCNENTVKACYIYQFPDKICEKETWNICKLTGWKFNVN